ncbi:MAG: trigger factor [Myxococcales bacterium FL481]|nr:MAG: trigger factor [Myxococcales bacterium FL481]
MESQIERISPVECRVKVQIAWADVSPRLETKFRDLKTRVRIPGFRRGKVPNGMLERLYGKGAREEVGRDLVNETFRNAVAKHNTVPLTEPVVESTNLVNGQPFTYAARFEVTPQIQLNEYKGLRVRRRPAVADEAAIDAELAQKQDELAEVRPLPENLERTETADGDLWTVDVEGSFADRRISHKDVEIEIGSAKETVLPGLAEKLASTPLAAVGSTIELSYEPDQGGLRPEYRGQSIEVNVGLRQVRQKVRPALDDEFARDTGDADSLEELRGKIRDRLREEDQAQAERDARHRLVQELLKRNPFDPAPSMVQREVAGQVERVKAQLQQQGMNLAQLGMDEGRLAQNVRGEAVFNITGFLLLDAIGKAEGINVDESEVDKELEEMAAEQGTTVARLRPTMEKNQQLLLLRAQIRESKILDFLMENSDVYEEADPEEAPAEAAPAVGEASVEASSGEASVEASSGEASAEASSGEASAEASSGEATAEASSDEANEASEQPASQPNAGAEASGSSSSPESTSSDASASEPAPDKTSET